MPHRRKKSLDEGRPPKRRGANRRKSQPDPITAMYAGREEGLPAKRSKQPRKAAGGTRTRSPSSRRRGKKVAAVKRPTRRSRAA